MADRDRRALSTPPHSTSTLAQALQNAAAHLSVVTTMLNTDATAVVDETGIIRERYRRRIKTMWQARSRRSVPPQARSTRSSRTSHSEQAAVAQAQAQLAQTLAGIHLAGDCGATGAGGVRRKPMCKASMSTSRMRRFPPLSTASLRRKTRRSGRSQRRGRSSPRLSREIILKWMRMCRKPISARLPSANAVSMTFDAFPGETFAGKVFYIDPAETI